MKPILRTCSIFETLVTGLCCLAVFSPSARAAEPGRPAAQSEAQLIQVLQSTASPAEKAITCKRLAIYGTKNAVPVLAPLLADPDLSSWARTALEAIPDSSADQALREALSKLDGRLLIGVINSIGVRRDARAIEGLAEHLSSRDGQVAAAAAESMGQVGGDAAAQALTGALRRTSAEQGDLRSALALGCVLCAEHLLDDGQADKAARLYDLVRAADLPQQRILEATRGAILARGAQGLPLLVEQLRSDDQELFGIGLRTARELPGRDITEALAAELGRFSPERQAPLLLALADRRDAAVLPSILSVAGAGSGPLRVVAVGLLDQLGDASCVPVLLDAATAGDAELAKTAKLTLGRLEGSAVDADLIQRLPGSTGLVRQALIEVAGQRRISEALPMVMESAQASDPAMRRVAVEALGALGGESEAPALVRMLEKTEARRDQAGIERALMMICARVGQGIVPHLRPLLGEANSSLRLIGLHLMASVGGAEALQAVAARLEDTDETVQDEVVRTLSSWPSNWPQDVGVAGPLLNLARTGKKPAHQIQGLRGYLDYVREDRGLSAGEKIAKVEGVLPLIQRPEEKRLVIAVLSGVPTAKALAMQVDYTADPAVAEEACVGIVSLAAKDNLEGGTTELRRQALQVAVDTSKDNRTRRRAQETLKLLK